MNEIKSRSASSSWRSLFAVFIVIAGIIYGPLSTTIRVSATRPSSIHYLSNTNLLPPFIRLLNLKTEIGFSIIPVVLHMHMHHFSLQHITGQENTITFKMDFHFPTRSLSASACFFMCLSAGSFYEKCSCVILEILSQRLFS